MDKKLIGVMMLGIGIGAAGDRMTANPDVAMQKATMTRAADGGITFLSDGRIADKNARFKYIAANQKLAGECFELAAEGFATEAKAYTSKK